MSGEVSISTRELFKAIKSRWEFFFIFFCSSESVRGFSPRAALIERDCLRRRAFAARALENKNPTARVFSQFVFPLGSFVSLCICNTTFFF